MRNQFIIVAMALTICLFISPSPLSADAAPHPMEKYWGKLHDKLGDTLVLLDEQRTLPDNSWIPFKADKKSLDQDINELLAEAVEILNISQLAEIKDRINDCQSDIRRYQEKIGELQTEKLMAPKDTAAWKVWKKDIKDYEEKIAAYEQGVQEKEQAVGELTEELRQAFADTGIHLDPREIDTLIYSVTGDEDIEIISVFNNIKTITAKLKDLTVASDEQIDHAKRYYGMHTLLLKILLNLQQNYVDKVNEQYLPKLEDISADNQRLMANTRDLLANSPAHHRDTYQANLETQALTKRTIRLYRRYLETNRERVKQSRDKIMAEYRAAENTYQTVSTAYTLINMMRNADNLYNAISDLQVPELMTFENKEMKAEFKELSSKIGG